MRGYGLAAEALLLTIAEFSAAAAQPVTFYRQIAPILFEYCAPCHRPGEAGPFPLLTYGGCPEACRPDCNRDAAQV